MSQMPPRWTKPTPSSDHRESRSTKASPKPPPGSAPNPNTPTPQPPEPLRPRPCAVGLQQTRTVRARSLHSTFLFPASAPSRSLLHAPHSALPSPPATCYSSHVTDFRPLTSASALRHYSSTMSINVIKEGDVLRIVESSEPILDGAKLTLYTASELSALSKSLTAWGAAQLESTFQEDEDDWGSSLDSLVISEESK